MFSPERHINTRSLSKQYYNPQEREASIQDAMVRGSQELSVAARRASDTERLDLLTANEALAMNAFTIAARVIFNTIKHG